MRQKITYNISLVKVSNYNLESKVGKYIINKYKKNRLQLNKYVIE